MHMYVYAHVLYWVRPARLRSIVVDSIGLVRLTYGSPQSSPPSQKIGRLGGNSLAVFSVSWNV